MKERRQRTLEAYLDGRLTPRKRARVREWLSDDEDSRDYFEQTQALGGMVREAWSEGPPAPSPERLLAAIRPAMRQIDRERAQRPWWARVARRLQVRVGLGMGRDPAAVLEPSAAHGSAWGWATSGRFWGGAGWNPSLWEWVSGFSVAAASVSAALFWGGSPSEIRYEAQHFFAPPTTPATFLSDAAWPASVYDLADGASSPLVVYEGDGATVIYVGEEPTPVPDDLSLGTLRDDWA